MEIPRCSIQDYKDGKRVSFIDPRTNKKVVLRLWDRREFVPPSRQGAREARKRAPEVVAEYLGAALVKQAQSNGIAVSVGEWRGHCLQDPGHRGHLSERSKKTRLEAFNVFMGWLETQGIHSNSPVTEITPHVIQKFIALRMEGGKVRLPSGKLGIPCSIRKMEREIGCIRRGFNWCLDQELLHDVHRNPVKMSYLTRGQNPEQRRRNISNKAWDQKTLQVLLDNCNTTYEVNNRGTLEERAMTPIWMYTAILVLSKTGMRVGELQYARWDEVNWENGLLELKRGKTGARSVILRDEVLAHLKEWKAWLAENGIYTDMIIAQDNGKGLGVSVMQQAFRRYRDRLGLPDVVVLYGARHRAAQTLADQLPVHKVMTVMGHKDIRTTSIYLKTTVDQIADEVKGVKI